MKTTNQISVSPEAVTDSMRQILAAESAAVASIPVSDEYARAVEAIVERVHRAGGKLVTSGMGKAGQIAMNIATTFSSTGTPAVFLHPAEAQHGDLGILRPDDIMLLISNSGKTREIVDLISLARPLCPDMKFIVITGDPDSLLAREGDIVLLTGHQPEVSARTHAHYIDYGHDCYRRCSGRECHGGYRL